MENGIHRWIIIAIRVYLWSEAPFKGKVEWKSMQWVIKVIKGGAGLLAILESFGRIRGGLREQN